MGLFGRSKEAPVKGTLTMVFKLELQGVVTYTLDVGPGPRVWQAVFGVLMTEEEHAAIGRGNDRTLGALVDPMMPRAFDLVFSGVPSMHDVDVSVDVRKGEDGDFEVFCSGPATYLPSEWQRLSSAGRAGLRRS